MNRRRLWSYLDEVMHFLYEPTAMGRRMHRMRWHHHIHLAPGSMVGYVCYRYDLMLGLDESESRQGYCIYRTPRSMRRCWRYNIYDGLCAKHYGTVHKNERGNRNAKG